MGLALLREFFLFRSFAIHRSFLRMPVIFFFFFRSFAIRRSQREFFLFQIICDPQELLVHASEHGRLWHEGLLSCFLHLIAL
jgi:hypothetical protein